MRLALVLAICGLALAGGAAVAQTAPAQTTALPENSALLTLDEDRLFTSSEFGKALLARQETESTKLATENRRIESALEEEEKALTLRRAAIPREEFTPLADAFNAKVEGIRSAQSGKERELARALDIERQRLLEAVRPILSDILTERGASVIIDKRAVFAGFENIDITADVIARLDALFAAGDLGLAAP